MMSNTEEIGEERREERLRQLKINSRFSLQFGQRLPLATTLSFLVGMGLGVSHGSTFSATHALRTALYTILASST